MYYLGYIRIILAIFSLYYMPLHPRTCSALYAISCLLDALDGYAARIFNQGTQFGAVLDMVTDRCTTSCLLVYLATAIPRWAIVFQGLIALDFASHYMHMYASLVIGGTGSSHKNIDSSQGWLMKVYYSNKVCSLYDGGVSLVHLTSRSRLSCFLFARSTSSSSSLATSCLSHLPSFLCI